MKRKLTPIDLTQIALMVVLIAVGAFTKIPFPTVPLTLQFFFINLGILILNKNKTAWAMAVYIFAGLIGLPVFASGGGPSYIFHPTFGYLIGMLLGAYAGGKLKDALVARMKDRDCKKESFVIFIKSSLVNLVFVYALGLPFMIGIMKLYLGLPVPVEKLVMAGFVLTIPGDMVKIGVSILAALKLDRKIS